MARTVEQGFNTFIENLHPLKPEHDKATSHKSSVESCLKNAFGMTSMFETGSFGNGTGVRHHSDTDYFAVIPTKNLKDNSANSLREVKEALKITFPRTTDIAVDSPAVQIPFGTYASEILEVTPCCFMGFADVKDGKKYRQYDIADGSGYWIKASPEAHNNYVQVQDDRLYNKVKPLIRAIKAWKFKCNALLLPFIWSFGSRNMHQKKRL